jgi:cell division protein FtsB
VPDDDVVEPKQRRVSNPPVVRCRFFEFDLVFGLCVRFSLALVSRYLRALHDSMLDNAENNRLRSQLRVLEAENAKLRAENDDLRRERDALLTEKNRLRTATVNFTVRRSCSRIVFIGSNPYFSLDISSPHCARLCAISARNSSAFSSPDCGLAARLRAAHDPITRWRTCSYVGVQST